MTVLLGSGLAPGKVQAQTAGGASSQDKQFLKDTAQDSNYEIGTGQLALQKSQSADVKQYANMVIRDHTQLKPEIVQADAAAQVKPVDSGSMAIGDTASYGELKVLSGDSFDKAYIKGLVKGNADGVKEAKSEAADSTLPAVKKLAERRVALDSKHTQKAEQLAQAHGIEAQK